MTVNILQFTVAKIQGLNHPISKVSKSIPDVEPEFQRLQKDSWVL